MSDLKPLCFVLMPFGIKEDSKGRQVNFDTIYENLIKPAIESADIEPIRADEELTGGTIHKPMFERLILCDYAIADLTSLNANVFYELGLRHAIRGRTTIPIYAFDAEIPFDLKMERVMPYKLNKDGKLIDKDATLTALIDKLEFCKNNPHIDSPVFQLVEGFDVSHNLSHEKTDVFRKQAEYDNDIKNKLLEARNKDKNAVIDIWNSLKPINQKSSGVVVDLYLSLRAVKGHAEMITLFEEMDKPLQNAKMIREQYGFALNRVDKKAKAEKVLLDVIDDFGSDPETNGILGRVFKDLYQKNRSTNKVLAKSYLKKAIKSYQEGFDADWRDAYPGVNLVTLAELDNQRQLVEDYLPIVEFAAKKKMKKPQYWDLATLAELKIIEGAYSDAEKYLNEAVGLIPDKEYWMLNTTINNIKLIEDERIVRGENVDSLSEFIASYTELYDSWVSEEEAPKN